MWEEQWKRVQRCYEALKQNDTGRAHDRDSDFYVDEMYAFFQNCYHLKDWLKNDQASTAVVTDIEAIINASPSVGPKHFSLSLGLGKPKISATYEVHSGGSVWDAFNLATACMDEWRRYLGRKGLTT